jgi:hypothetical protein
MTRTKSCTIDEFAEATDLPASYLSELGIKEVRRKERPAVQLSDALTFLAPPPPDDLGDDQAVERKGSNSALFGLDTLDLIPAAGSVYLVADEIEALTLRFRGLPALAVPPVARWADDWPALDEAPIVYVVITDTDEQAEPPAWAADAPFRDRVRLVRLIKDFGIRHLHRHSPRFFRDGWKTMCEGAIPLADFEDERCAEFQAEAARRCAGLIGDPDILARFAIDIDRAGFAGDTRVPKLLYLVTITRLFEQPVSAAVKGPSSAGKSFLVKKVLEFLPEAAVHAMTSSSDKSLIYLTESLAHRLLVVYEADGMGDYAQAILRSLLSEGHILYDTVVCEEGSLPTGRRIEVEGPTGFITTTTRTMLHPENETRYLSLTLPDTPEQTREVARRIGEQAAGSFVAVRPDPAWLALQEFLQVGSTAVVVPFASALVERVDVTAPRMRRDLNALFQLIKAHALLHQETRERDDEDRIVAAITDYAAVHALVHQLYAENVEQAVPAEVRELVQAVQQMGPDGHADGDGVSIAQIQSKLASSGTSIDRTSVQRRLKRAFGAGLLIDLAGGGRGKAKRIVLGDRLDYEDGSVLPTPAELEEVCVGACTTA